MRRQMIAVLLVLLLSLFGSPGTLTGVEPTSCNAELGAVITLTTDGVAHMRCLSIEEAKRDPFTLEVWRRACEEDGWVQYCLPQKKEGTL